MCFTPAASLTTAILEWLLVAVLLLKYKNTSLRNFFAVLITVLGFYQFTQFMLCITNYEIFWAQIGFITYSFLPAIGLHAISSTYKKNFSPFALYIVPTLALVYTFVKSNFIAHAVCTSYFVEVFFGLHNSMIAWMYIAYYFGFIALMFMLALISYWNEKIKAKRSRDMAIMFSIILMMAPTFILMVIFPILQVRFPSVLCGFAVLTAICSFIAVHFEQK